MLGGVGGSSMKGARRLRLSLWQVATIREYLEASSERLKSVPGGPYVDLTGGDPDYLGTERTCPTSRVDPGNLSEREGQSPCRDRSSPIRTCFTQELNHVDPFLESYAPPRPRGFRIDCLPHLKSSGLVTDRNKTSNGCLAVTDRYSTSTAHMCKVRTQLRPQFRYLHELMHD